MALWKRIAFLAFGVMFLFMSVSVVILVQLQTKALQQANEEYVERELLSFCTNINLAVEQQEKEYSIAAGRSVVQYYFAKATSLLQSEEQYYSLAQEGEYLYHRCPYGAENILDAKAVDALEVGQVLIGQDRVAEKYVLVGGTTLVVGKQSFQVYLSLDVNDTWVQIQRMWCIGGLVLTVASVSGAVMIALLLRYKLRPLVSLTETAQAIAQGNYGLRTACATGDEIGQLSVAFDHMAQSIEEKIGYLDGEIHKRQLLVGAVSHEIRTPLTTIMGYGDTLLRMPVNEEQRIECARHIVKACKHAEMTAQKMMQLISLYEGNALEKRWIAVDELVECLKEQFGERVEMVQEVEHIYGDRVLLENLLYNLIQNALRASEEQGQDSARVSEHLEIEADIATVQVCFWKKPAEACIRVTDKGRGIEASQIPLLTEPFYRVDKTRSRKTGGIGLGLAICKLIAEVHGGVLAIRSTLGEGTVVEVTLELPTS